MFDTWSMASRAAPVIEVNLQQPADGVSAVPVQASWLQLASEAAWSQLTEEEQSAATAPQRRGEVGTEVGLAVVGSEHGFAWPGSVALT